MSNPRLASRQKAKSPFLTAVGERSAAFFAPIGKFLARDLLSTFLLVASIVLLVLFFTLIGSLGSEGTGHNVPLSTIEKLAEGSGSAKRNCSTTTTRSSISTDTGIQLYANYPSDGSATQELAPRGCTQNGAIVEFNPQSGKSTRVIVIQFLIPILLLVCLFSFFMRQTGDGSSGIGAFSAFGGKGKRRKKGQKAPVTFDSVAGAGEALAELKEIRDFLEDPTKYNAMGAAAPKGVLLVGPPGTGKTLLARATAGEADAAFFCASGAEFVESLVGVGAARIRDLFAKARKTARRSSSSTSSTPPGASAAPASARATTSASRR